MHYGRTSLEGREWYTGHPPGQTLKGIYLTTTLDMILHILALYTHMWGCVSGGILSVGHNAGSAEGPGKIFKYRCNLRQNSVNFSNKLCILVFIILSIWQNFFDPPSFTMENFLVPPFRQLKTFLAPPLHFAQPPHQSIYEHSLTFLSFFGPQKKVFWQLDYIKVSQYQLLIQWEGISVLKHAPNLHSYCENKSFWKTLW